MTHWTTDTKQVETFNGAAGRQGYTPDEALEALGVKAITDLRGPIGQALTELQKVKKSAGRSASALAVLPDSELRPLYESDDLFQFGKMIRSFAPWANDDSHPMTDTEVALVVQRGAKSGLDVLNPHEVQVWKDNKGIKFQISYSLMAQWANVTLGGHTQPRYYELTDEERESHGVKEHDHVIRCEFVMRSDIPMLKLMVDAGWEPQEARADITMAGVGVVSASDWGGKYFAPNARSKRWKLEKRAYIDALRRRYGTPSEKDIFNLRRARGEDNIAPGDWVVAQDEKNGDARVKHAKASANGNSDQGPAESPEEILKRNRDILRGDPDDGIIPGVIVQEPEIDTTTGEIVEETGPREPETAPERKSNGRSWPAESVKALVEHSHADAPPHAVAILNLSNLDPKDGLDLVLGWANVYRDARNSDAKKDAAAGMANAWLVGEMPATSEAE